MRTRSESCTFQKTFVEKIEGQDIEFGIACEVYPESSKNLKFLDSIWWVECEDPRVIISSAIAGQINFFRTQKSRGIAAAFIYDELLEVIKRGGIKIIKPGEEIPAGFKLLDEYPLAKEAWGKRGPKLKDRERYFYVTGHEQVRGGVWLSDKPDAALLLSKDGCSLSRSWMGRKLSKAAKLVNAAI